MSRTKYTIKNITYSYVNMFVSIALNFITRSIFIYTLGSTYLGINGLFSNVLSMLSIAEIGIGSAINYSLYKPLAKNDVDLISKLMSFYKRAYRVIGGVIAVLGIIIIPFIKYIIKGADSVDNLYVIYLFFLADTVLAYYLTYKTTLITANQKAYKLIPLTIWTSIFSSLVQAIVLLLYKNFLFYLGIRIITGFLQRSVLNRYITKLYDYVNFKSENKIPEEELNIIKRNIKGIMIGKIGDFCINGTDNIIISTYISIQVVGIYSNYYMIISLVQQLLSTIFSSATSSLGNLIVSDNKEKQIKTFNIMNFFAFWIFGWTMICLIILLDHFIFLWIGKEYLISQAALIVVIINYYLVGMRIPLGTMLIAGGVNYPGRYMGLVQSAINLIVSIILVKSLGLTGVFLGTLVSSITTVCWFRPYLTYKYIFKSSVKAYYKTYLTYIIVVAIACLSTYILCNMAFVEFTWVNFIARIIVCVTIPNTIFILLYRKTYEFKKLVSLANGIIKKYIKFNIK